MSKIVLWVVTFVGAALATVALMLLIFDHFELKYAKKVTYTGIVRQKSVIVKSPFTVERIHRVHVTMRGRSFTQVIQPNQWQKVSIGDTVEVSHIVGWFSGRRLWTTVIIYRGQPLFASRSSTELMRDFTFSK